MKYSMILAFFAAILAVSAIQSGNNNFARVYYPKKWLTAIQTCMENIQIDVYRSLQSYNKATASREAKQTALCLYRESERFVGGRFDPDAIERFLREYINPSHQLLDKAVRIYRAAAVAGNAEPGNDCDKAYAFHATLGIPANAQVLNALFRSPADTSRVARLPF